MKRCFPLIVLLVCGVASLSAETVQETYARGVRAYIGGNNDAAKVLFTEVLRADPKNASAAAYLKRINAAKPPADLRKQMESLVVSKIDFSDTSLSTVLDYLPKLAAKESGGKVALNLVRMFPAEIGEKPITLKLNGAPMSSVLDYVSQMAGLKVEYQTHAVVLALPKTAAQAAPQAPQ